MSVKLAIQEAKQALKSGDSELIEKALQSLELECGSKITDIQKSDKIVLSALLKHKMLPKKGRKQILVGGGLMLLASSLLLFVASYADE